MTVVVSTSSAMPNPLWRTMACPLCRWIWPLTLHSWPGMVTLPQFTLCALSGLRGRRLRDQPAVAVRAVTAASDDTMSLMFFTGPLP